MIVKFSPSFLKISKKVDVRIRKSLREKITIFYHNPNNPQLNNYPLKDEYRGCRSIDITNDWRAIYKEVRVGKEIVAYFIFLGTHKELYKN